MTGVLVTTSDNPWNPFTRFDEWYAFDEYEKNYRTCERLACLFEPDYEASEAEQDQERENAIDRLIELFPFGPLNAGLDANGEQIVYKKVYENEKEAKTDEKQDEND